MPITVLPPLAVYVHIPWCVRKCPYCDFNSHQQQGDLPISEYVTALKKDLQQDLAMAQGRKIHSLFFGGGTPSLFPAAAIADIIDTLEDNLGFESGAEITLEANPGTAEHGNFCDLRGAGVNRLSIGVQSFNSQHLERLGRIHSRDEAINAFDMARDASFDNINIDLMHGLPQQTVEEGIADIHQAITLQPNHISWYQLTIEPNTEFYKRPPSLPEEDTLLDIQKRGHERLVEAGFEHYEVSAYCQPQKASAHNLNYWQFGDYLGLGAGAHGKITQFDKGEIFRYHKTRLPRDYLDVNKSFTAGCERIAEENLPLEFMMNVMRLINGVPTHLFFDHTGLKLESIAKQLNLLKGKGLIEISDDILRPTPLGMRFHNNVLEAFMNSTVSKP